MYPQAHQILKEAKTARTNKSRSNVVLKRCNLSPVHTLPYAHLHPTVYLHSIANPGASLQHSKSLYAPFSISALQPHGNWFCSLMLVFARCSNKVVTLVLPDHFRLLPILSPAFADFSFFVYPLHLLKDRDSMFLGLDIIEPGTHILQVKCFRDTNVGLRPSTLGARHYLYVTHIDLY